MVSRVRPFWSVLAVALVLAVAGCSSGGGTPFGGSSDSVAPDDTADPAGAPDTTASAAATTEAGPAKGASLIRQLVSAAVPDLLRGFCDRAVGTVHPPEVFEPSANSQNDRNLPVIECGYGGRDPSLFYTDDQDNTEYYVSFVAGWTTVDIGDRLDDTDIGSSPAAACPETRDPSVMCAHDGEAVVAFDVVEPRDVFVHVDGATILLFFQNAGVPTVAEVQARALGAVEALGLELPESLRNFQALAGAVPVPEGSNTDPAELLTSCEGLDMGLVADDAVGTLTPVCSFPWALITWTDMASGGPRLNVALVRSDERRVITMWNDVEDGPATSGYSVAAMVAKGVPADRAQAMFDAAGGPCAANGACGGTSTTVVKVTRCRGPLTFNETLPLRICQESSAIEFAQNALVLEGYDIEVDGQFGPATEAAVKSFQSSQGLEPDGLIGFNTWKALFALHPLGFPDLDGNGVVTPDEIPYD